MAQFYHTIPQCLTYYSIPCHTPDTIPYYAILFHIMSYYSILCHAIPYYAILFHNQSVPYLWDSMAYYSILCHSIPYYSTPVLLKPSGAQGSQDAQGPRSSRITWSTRITRSTRTTSGAIRNGMEHISDRFDES